jgi:putative membrane protein
MNFLQWLIPWEPAFSVAIVTALAAMLFIRGSLKYKLLFRQKLCFWTGLLSLYAVSHTQADYYAEHEFFIHQLQSLVLHHMGPFLIVLSRPKEALSAGCPVAGRRMIGMISAWKPVQYLINALFNPVAVVIIFVGLIIFWLLPSIHFIAMIDWRIYRLMNWSMVLSGLIFWGVAMDSHSKWSPGSRIGMMLAVIPPQILIGTLIFFTPHELYPIYTLCGRAFTGMSSVTDQQIGGVIIWMNAAMMSVIGILIVIQKELGQPGLASDRALPAKTPPDKCKS